MLKKLIEKTFMMVMSEIAISELHKYLLTYIKGFPIIMI